VSDSTAFEASGPVAALLKDLRAHLSWQRDVSGAEVMGSKRSSKSVVALAEAVPMVAVPQVAQTVVKAPAPAAQLRRTLDEVRRELGDCKRCKLCEGRKQIVFGSGNPKARLVFVGEGPGAEEDAQGLPFVGAAGQLLTKMIVAMGLQRDNVYICNVVKCRPPGNRNPEPDEISACEPFLRAQLDAIRPEVVVALGKFAAQTLLREATPITRLRGQWRTYQGMRLMPTFHPAYLLRNPAEKKPCWEDLKAVMAVLAKAAPPP
jgi:uracil-DNA glycosylase family 4